jgi:queuine tRNA-ribosyltransferase
VQAARELRSLDFPGYAIGGLSIGESWAVTGSLVAATTPELPSDRPRYLMGVGTPEQILEYVALGVDMFDCVLPTRLGRTGLAFVPGGRLNLRRAECRDDPAPVDEGCDCMTCCRYSRGFLHIAFRERWPLAARLLSLHNVRTLVRLTRQARATILGGSFPQLLATAFHGAASTAACDSLEQRASA